MRVRSNLILALFFAGFSLIAPSTAAPGPERVLTPPARSPIGNLHRVQSLAQLEVPKRGGEHFIISTSVKIIIAFFLFRLVDRQQRRLRRTEQRYRVVFEHATDGIAIMAASDCRIVDANRRFAGMLGYNPDRIVGKSLSTIMGAAVDGPHAERLDAIFGGLASSEVDLPLSTRTGALFLASISSSSLAMDKEKLVVVIMRDRSERVRLESERDLMQRQLYQKSKLESLGELSAGVAHEINNPLNCIINFAQLLKDDAQRLDESEQRMVQGIIDEGNRITKIVKNLLTFARRDLHDLGTVDVAETISNSMSLFGRQLQMDGIRVEIELAMPLPGIIADASRLRQVIVNLISNARNSLKDKHADDKLFRISARSLSQGDNQIVRLEFLDNGVGIAKEDLDRVFDPFFTTRREGGGTGLGLSLAFGIIQEYGGTISVDSRKGEFARFVVQIPAAGVNQYDHSAIGR